MSFTVRQHKGKIPEKVMPIVLAEDADANGSYQRYEVEKILKHRLRHHKRRRADGSRAAKRLDGIEYLVKWKGFDIIHNTWKPARNVDKADDLLREYWQHWSRENPNETPLYFHNHDVA